MSATHTFQFTEGAAVLYVAMDLGVKTWTLAFTVGMGQSPRIRKIPGGAYPVLLDEIKSAKRRFKLPQEAPVASCYEAGPHGFQPHRRLVELGIHNIVVDSASIEVSRRKKSAKTDRLDSTKLVFMLVRWQMGETKVWRVVNVPSVEDEDRRQLHRELVSLKKERTEHSNRIKGLLFTSGFRAKVGPKFPLVLEQLRQLPEHPLPQHLYERLLREYERWVLVNTQIHQLEKNRVERIRSEKSPQADQVRQLLELRGVGVNGSWLAVHEVFGWREIKNRRQLGGLTGLAPTPYGSGDSEQEQGISKAGNRRLRALMIELAWSWLKYQPQSDLSKWYRRRFAEGNSRQRRIGIVALARKLLVALWKYLDQGEVPGRAEVVPWEDKLPKRRRTAA
jgi:transposase